MKAVLFKLALAKLKGEQTMIKRYLSLLGIGTLALLVAVPANAKTVDKNKAINPPFGILWDIMVYYSTFQEKKKKLDDR